MNPEYTSQADSAETEQLLSVIRDHYGYFETPEVRAHKEKTFDLL